MEETSEELPNFSIGIDLLGPDPTSSKNKAELKKLASCAFRKFVGRPTAANFGRKTFTGNRTDTNRSSTTFKGAISVFIVVYSGALAREARASGAPWVSKCTHPRKFGNHVTERTYTERTTVRTTGIPMFNLTFSS